MYRVILVIALCGTAAFAGPPGSRREQREQLRFTETLGTLNLEVENVRFENTPLEAVLEWFRDNGLDSMAIFWSAIEQQSGVDRQTPITLTLPDATLGEVLDWVLALASQEATVSEEQLTYHIDRGVIVIATARYFNGKVVVRIYDIVDVVQPIPYWGRGGPKITGRQRALLRRSATVDVDGGRRLMADPSGSYSCNGNLQDIKEAHVVELMDALFQLKPETWEREGGKGWIRRFKDRLIIAQTIEVHEMIGGPFRQSH